MAFDNNKLGDLRPNQIITTFGPGSIVDAVKTPLPSWIPAIGSKRA